jgi:hypothetical protein
LEFHKFLRKKNKSDQTKDMGRPAAKNKISLKTLFCLVFRDMPTSKQKRLTLELRRGLRPRIRFNHGKDPRV